jgi:hypothetical protein
MVFSVSYEDEISSHAYRYFDFEIVGAKIYRCMIAFNQPVTGRNMTGRGGYGHTAW